MGFKGWAALVLTFALGVASFAAEEWTQFRGPGGLGVSTATGLPVEWDGSTNITWKTDLPGPGTSSPVVYGDRMFLTCYSGYGLNVRGRGESSGGGSGNIEDLTHHVICLDADSGNILWDKKLDQGSKRAKFGSFLTYHGYASSTPAVDGDAVYVFFGPVGVFAFSHEGEQLWQADVGNRTHGWGTGSSPLLYQDKVIVNAGVESGSLVALDRKTGEEVWSQGGMTMTWVSPMLGDAGDREEVVMNVRRQVMAFDPATGRQLWHCDGIRDYVCSSVVSHEGVVYVIGGRRGKCLAVRAGGEGDVSDMHVLWEARVGSDVSSPVYHDGYLYWPHEKRGILYCVNAENGEVVYQEKLPSDGPAPMFYASPILADGRLYYVSRRGGTYVVAAKPEFELLAHNTIESDDTVFNAAPIVDEDRLLIRSGKALYCIGK